MYAAVGTPAGNWRWSAHLVGPENSSWGLVALLPVALFVLLSAAYSVAFTSVYNELGSKLLRVSFRRIRMPPILR